MRLTAGIDVGAIFTKAVILSDLEVVSWAIIPSGGDFSRASEQALREAIKRAQREPEVIFATGVGASKAGMVSRTLSDVSCHARGMNFYFPSVREVIDIGGQSTKVIRVDERGRALEFTVSEKCAAGSARFLQIIAKVLRINFEDIGKLSLLSLIHI